MDVIDQYKECLGERPLPVPNGSTEDHTQMMHEPVRTNDSNETGRQDTLSNPIGRQKGGLAQQ
ncbi:unnamed protein product, partial [Nesidiocoris tenuis]